MGKKMLRRGLQQASDISKGSLEMLPTKLSLEG